MSIKSDYEYLLGQRIHASMSICAWQDFDSKLLDLRIKISKHEKVTTCFPALAIPITLEEQRKVAEIWCEDKHPNNASLGSIDKRLNKKKICVGYYSSDFRIHPVSLLTAGLFEQHNKNQFEIIAFSYAPVTSDEMTEKIKYSVDKFIDVRELSDKEVARKSRELGVDIAVDLGGYTQFNRSGIFAYRAAPMQLSYIGFLGTMGATYYDYIVADKTMIPVQSQKHYAEKIIYLPCYQVNDYKLNEISTSFNKQDLNLPTEGFIYCCFNSLYKITPSTFHCWMRILNSVPKSILYLYGENLSAIENLRLEAASQNVNPERIIFGGKLSRDQYLARFKVVDLFLDTLPYNAGTTASDSLWAGLPVLTCMGENFASRYAASLLHALQLPELVAETQAEYEFMAIELGRNPEKLKVITKKLEKNRLTTALFDTKKFTKYIESAYHKIYERYQADLPLDHIDVQELKLQFVDPKS